MISRKKSRIAAGLVAGRRSVRTVPAWLAAIVLLFLVACAPLKPRVAVVGDQARQGVREAELARHPSWSFRGRLAISQGSEGGSARIEWRQDGTDFDIQLSAPITRQSWHLRQTAGKVSLEGMAGGVRQGDDAEALLLQATGWRIPLVAMSAWVRGARAPGSAEFTADPRGLPATLNQDGWAVEYRGWGNGALALPEKVFARNGPASVRLVVESWSEQ